MSGEAQELLTKSIDGGAAVAAGKKRKVLVVDDDNDVRKVLHLFCEHFGYEVMDASDGLECVQKVQRERPDIVFLDYNMPIDGKNAALQLKRYDGTSRIPLIGTGDFPSVDGEMPSYLTDRIHKPFRLADAKRMLDTYAPLS